MLTGMGSPVGLPEPTQQALMYHGHRQTPGTTVTKLMPLGRAPNGQRNHGHQPVPKHSPWRGCAIHWMPGLGAPTL